MLEKRIHYSESKKGYNITQDIWKEYFAPTINRERIPITTYMKREDMKKRQMFSIRSVITKNLSITLKNACRCRESNQNNTTYSQIISEAAVSAACEKNLRDISENKR